MKTSKTYLEHKITIAKIAEIAGVWTATVSRVISGIDYVGISTKVKVERAIKEYGYFPNHAASQSGQMNSSVKRAGPGSRKQPPATMLADASKTFIACSHRSDIDPRSSQPR